ncbi:ArsR family transcriptional regulator [Streptomyces ipomoeae]|jgi:ArsR family transcriptional regulator|uniref:ArsR family transcriptional regulator n=1 Tax=Streptomyces ipomoeae TaxID=103232 RepID=A0AAE9AZS4_9ACTN|nr:ArsR family transcriptional regulator [Streptomyces ipomoeae]MDX2696825.1 ArsR family transcriptional regulator [Streptomyces ipomoeae]MDX2824406.1 ArsR family transcriptional regulator [Streptomyces ipomoeae]MDX2842570.1 ArsR family transcriptional regulator [Streptomyces ipomoeae]MDX2873753.1 ArsR family transcriptional regulator [Streptomyces ipomoeae]TQE28124.1 ArsR family transcriptional regulator [Streptomyces ipomoeae]
MLRVPVGRRRLDVLEWLRDPVAHFPPQGYGDLVEDGVGVGAVAVKLGVSRAVARTDLELLAAIGLLRTREIGGRTLYRCDEPRITEVSHIFERGW